MTWPAGGQRAMTISDVQARALAAALLSITRSVAESLEWTTCLADGCLVQMDEQCPACRARREKK